MMRARWKLCKRYTLVKLKSDDVEAILLIDFSFFVLTIHRTVLQS